jgi:hypothetical protein
MQEWQYPQQREGFHAIRIARSSEEAQALARQVLSQHGSPAAPAPPTAVPSQQLPEGLPTLRHASAPALLRPPSVAAASLAQQQQQGWQQQQERGFSSKPGADLAASWRPPACSDEGSTAPPRPKGHERMPQAARAGGAGNVVPFPGKAKAPPAAAAPPVDPHLPRRHPWCRHGHDEPSGRVLDAGLDAARPVLMFDANGVLTTHTSMRRSVGVHRARPGVHHLRRLQARALRAWASQAQPHCLPVPGTRAVHLAWLAARLAAVRVLRSRIPTRPATPALCPPFFCRPDSTSAYTPQPATRRCRRRCSCWRRPRVGAGVCKGGGPECQPARS